MTHDHLCEQYGKAHSSVNCGWCSAFTRVRADERARVREAVAKAPVGTGGYATKQADLAAIDALA